MFVQKLFLSNALKSPYISKNCSRNCWSIVWGLNYMSGVDCSEWEDKDATSSQPASVNKSVSYSYPNEVEKHVNAQIRNEMQASHTYLAMAQRFAAGNYFEGFAGSHLLFTHLFCVVFTTQKFDNILHFSALYLEMSKEERSHALSLIGYQNLRGGTVVLEALNKPEIPFKDVATSLNFALDLENRNTIEFTRLHDIALLNNDLMTKDLITSTYLTEQAVSVHFIRNLIAQLDLTANDPIVQQLMNQTLRRQFASKCLGDLKRLTSKRV